MDTIDTDTIERAAKQVEQRIKEGNIIDTVTITLNGAHGGADVRIQGSTPDGDAFGDIDETIVVGAASYRDGEVLA